MQTRQIEYTDAVLVAWENDYHAQAVAARIRDLGRTALVFDISRFPTEVDLVWQLAPEGQALELAIRGAAPILIGPNTGVWWRRPTPHNLSDVYAHPKIRGFAASESRHALLGALMASTKSFLNNPFASQQAALKPFQLSVAQLVGLNIPCTLTTNRAQSVLDASNGRYNDLVYKLLGGPDFGFFETRILDPVADASDLALLQNCPAIFQEHVEGDFDLRITVVGQQCFPGRIDYVNGQHPVDSRIDPTGISPFILGSGPIK
ncbi:hypothetical protein ELI30_08625 [Rhizobium leguminosarum]|uniref:MvdC/MvdD family ATP grasp protein n=1 Tax=Rhizobium leguminosarum TaxID=384 RepID=UPI001030FB7D|nr:hypothetical protein [Rhizobium leguminosarum]TAV48361.1 hypothetical protein ELI32_09080 [Rhizobium leguminosarum]TAV57861.1 hypothetical protein ELI31_08610 [Rhizobium leguminosarum]TAV68801.1 hypothetical protein ELI30_08625 [Rhizobium leguminosarum]